MNDKYPIFSKIIHNSIIRKYIFQSVHWIHVEKLNSKPYKWNQIVEIPHVLIDYQYFDLVIDHFKQIKNHFYNVNFLFIRIQQTIIYYIVLNRLDLIQQLFNQLSIIYKDIDFKESYLDTYKLLHSAVYHNRFNIIQYLLESPNKFKFSLSAASVVPLLETCLKSPTASFSPVQLVEYLVSIANINFNEISLRPIIQSALEYDDLDLFKWFEKVNPHDIEFNRIAIHQGTTFHVLKYLFDTGRDFVLKRLSILNLITTYRADIVDWLRDNNLWVPQTKPSIVLKSYSELDNIEYLLEKSFNITIYYRNYDENNNSKKSLETMKWIHNQQNEQRLERNLLTFNWNTAMDFAADFNHLDIVIWLHENRTEGCTVNAMNRAAKNGNLEIVKWLHANRTEGCTYSAMDEAVIENHFEVVRWLHKNRTEGCTQEALDNAALFNHPDMVQWLIANTRSIHCPYSYKKSVTNSILSKDNHQYEMFNIIIPHLANNLNKGLEDMENQSIFKLFSQACIFSTFEIVVCFHSYFKETLSQFENHDHYLSLFEKILEADNDYREILNIITFIYTNYLTSIPAKQITSILFNSCKNVDVMKYFIETMIYMDITNLTLIRCIDLEHYNIAAWLIENYQDRLTQSKAVVERISTLNTENTIDIDNFWEDTVKNLKILHTFSCFELNKN